MKIVKLQIDTEHTLLLLEGKTVAVKLPAGTEVVELRIVPQAKDTNDFVKLVDVFFNGRKA